jgi:hypothetical protein
VVSLLPAMLLFACLWPRHAGKVPGDVKA